MDFILMSIIFDCRGSWQENSFIDLRFLRCWSYKLDLCHASVVTVVQLWCCFQAHFIFFQHLCQSRSYSPLPVCESILPPPPLPPPFLSYSVTPFFLLLLSFLLCPLFLFPPPRLVVPNKGYSSLDQSPDEKPLVALDTDRWTQTHIDTLLASYTP